MKKTIWVVSEVYYPEEIGTAYYLTRLAEALSSDYEVCVLCGYPTYTARGTVVPAHEFRHGVHIERCRGTTLDKDNLVLRAVNLVSISLVLFITALFRIRPADTVMVVTNPPLLPFVIWAVCKVRGARCVLRIDDVYPEIFVATGALGPRHWLVRVFGYLTRRLYRSVDRLVVLGRDMAELAQQKLGATSQTVTIIPIWSDIDTIKPAAKADNALLKSLGLENKFIVQCAGNMGRAQAIETMFEAVRLLKARPEIHFVFIGVGAKRKWMEAQQREQQLANVSLVDYLPRTRQLEFLNACDVSMISLVSGMTGAGVPSRTYNAMAAGKPIIALAEANSELALVVTEEHIGWVVPPDQPARLAEVIGQACVQVSSLSAMGQRARAAAEDKYSPQRIIESYRALLAGLSQSISEG